MSPTPRSVSRSLFRGCVAAMSGSLMFSMLSVAQAADGTWTNISGGSAGGTWSDAATGNWLDGVVAGGSGSTAYFNGVNITMNSTVALGEARTIGNIVFGDTDTTTAGASWTISNGGNALNVLTLAGTTPTISVNALGASSLATITAGIAGTAGLTKDGVGILTLSGANTYSGGTNITAGTLRISSSSALGATSGAVTVASGARLDLQNSITVTNALNLNGTNALSLNSGAVVLQGAVTLQSASTLAMGSTTNASVDIQGDLALGANQFTISGSRPLTISGTISGTGTLNLANIGGTTIITGDNGATYSGQVNVARSTLAVGHDNALGTGTLLFGVNDQGSGIRSTDTTTRTIGNVVSLLGTTNSTYTFGSTTSLVNGDLTFSDTTAISLGTATKKFQVYNRTQFEAGFTGLTRGITMQTGTGILVLNGNSTYTGATTINAGTLLVNGSIDTQSAVAVNTGGRIGGLGSVGAVNFASGAALAYEVASVGQGGDGLTTTGFAGTGVGTFTIYLSGAATGFDADSNYTWAVLTSNSMDIASVTLSNLTLDTSGFGQAFTGDFTLSKDATSIYVNYIGSTIPEPSSYAMVAGGALLGFAVSRRRRIRA